MSEQPKPVKIDITSSVVEKGIDLAKEFIGKLISPAVEEVGLLVKEQVASWRFKNQVNILNRAREVCSKNNISTKSISLKLLVPFLEHASLEEDTYLQDKWAVLLSNLVDSDQNIENNVLPYILSQISKGEFVSLEIAYRCEKDRILQAKVDLAIFVERKESEIKLLMQQLREFQADLSDEELFKELKVTPYARIKSAYGKLEREETALNKRIDTVASIPNIGEFKNFEIVNLVRLGVFEVEKEFLGYSKPLRIENNKDDSYLYSDGGEVYIKHAADVFKFSRLGLLFMKACSEKYPPKSLS